MGGTYPYQNYVKNAPTHPSGRGLITILMKFQATSGAKTAELVITEVPKTDEKMNERGSQK